MAYTTEEQAQLNQLTADYQAKLTDYNAEKAMNDKGKANLAWSTNTGIWIFPYSGATTDEGSFKTWLAISDAATLNKLNAYVAAKTILEDYQNQLNDKYITNNPEVAIQTAAAQATAQANAQADVLMNAENKKFMQGTTKYLIIGAVALALIIAGVFIYRKKFKAA